LLPRRSRSRPIIDLDALAIDSPLVLAVGWRAGGGVDGGRIETRDTVAAAFRNVCARHIDALQGREAKRYSPDTELVAAEEYLVVPRADLDPDDPILELMEDVPSRDSLATGGLPERSLLLYAFVFEDGTAFVRKTNAYQSTRRGRILTRFTNALTTIDEPVFAFDDSVDIVITTDALLVSSESAFEHLFRSDELLAAHIPNWIHSISTHLPLADGAEDTLAERCQRSTRMRRRLEAIHHRGHLRDITITQVKNEAIRQGIEPSEIIHRGKLTFDDASTDVLLRLLNEDLFTGGLSNARFTVERKAPRV
jgi:hypothetical protein